MGREPIVPYPRNAPGPFYVEDQLCTCCEAPYLEAPTLMEADDEKGSYPHCYFKRQPETPEETEQAIMACVVSCVGAVRYGGHDPEILKRFRQLHCESACDALTARPGPCGQAHPLWDAEVDR